MNREQQLREFGRLISALSAGHVMSREESFEAYRQVILDLQPELQQGAFLSAHFMRNPTIEELSGAWDALDTFDTAKVRAAIDGPVCDIVGTGSDPLKTLNCSSPAALIAAGCGLAVAKKGARLVTGVSGASDIFECLGIDLDAPLEQAEQALNGAGICYLPGEAFLKSGWARLIESMRFTTAFNILGPLTRPCHENNCAVIGAYAPDVSDKMVSILREIGMPRALSPYGQVNGLDASRGIDEFSPCGPTRVVELRDGEIEHYELSPSDFGIREWRFDDIRSLGTARENADAVLDVLRGRYDGSVADFFCINAAAALYCSGLADDYRSATLMARESVASGEAMRKLEALQEYQGSACCEPG
ncbi:anthranilate phosphoribosyltransferase [Prosthecochloris sp. ZM_2]|uniref:anthranilate phosphoribosyltransferase n=1 Tax=Prosthecochloris sp. ZM_2 TaxID=2045206 RepID=UPI000DF85784|nr:anthranilate phosphoribosyltransferase [Prosthecochloris sp. ZM_2]RNA64904.1 anthranilate phosphoribosyltransferase [Prosthecochloris sp. ZM_2]